MNTDRTWDSIKLFVYGLIAIFFLMLLSPGWASEDTCRQGHEQCGHDDNGEDSSTVSSNAAGGAGGDGGEGGSVGDIAVTASSTSQGGMGGTGGGGQGGAATIIHERQVPNLYLHQTNQVEACGRVFGLSGANSAGAWAFGIPIPRAWTPTCDLWKAAEEAQQNGFIFTSYMFQCSVNAVRKVLGNETCNAFEAKALVELGLIVEEAAGGIWLPDDEYEALLMADVNVEEFQEQQKMVADKFAKYDNLIEAQEKRRIADDAEIERLKTEAAALRAAEQERKDRETARRAAARAALEKEDK